MKNWTVGAVLLAAGMSAQAAEPAGEKLSREWLELTYDVNYYNPYRTEEVRVKGVYGWRANSNIKIAPHLFLWGSYDYQYYDTQDSQDYERTRYALAKYGVSGEFPIGAGALLALRLSWQEHYDKDYFYLPGFGAVDFAYAARGFGYGTALTLPLAGGAEISASYEIAPLKSDAGNGVSFKERFRTGAVQLAVPLSRRLKFVLGVEQAIFTDKNPDLGLDYKFQNENVLVGLRYAL